MAAIVPSTITRESMGSLTLHIAYFATASTDTWKSGLPNAIGYWAVSPLRGIGIEATATGTTGVTFDICGGAEVTRVYVLSRT